MPNNRAVFITGAAAGIGRATALTFARNGYTVGAYDVDEVGLKTLADAISCQRLTSVEAVGAALSAGTNCGSCRPAIRRLIGETKDAAHG